MIERAVELLEREQAEDALCALLEGWRQRRSPALEEALLLVSDWVFSALPPIDDGDEAFFARERYRWAADVPLLVERALDPPMSVAQQRLLALYDRGPDPRVGQLLLSVIERPPTTSSSHFTLWTRLFSALPQHVDTRAIPRLQARAAQADGDSKFWPKFKGWIEAAIPKLPAPVEPSAEEIAQLPRLREVLSRLEPSFHGEDPQSELISERGSLEDALAALEQGDLARALDLLVSLWGDRRLPALAERIERLGLLVDASLPALEAGPELHGRWKALGWQARPSEVGRLLRSYRLGTRVEVEGRLELMLSWSPDPRVPVAMLGLANDYAVGSRPRTRDAAERLTAHHADPRSADEVLAHPRLASEDTQEALERARASAWAPDPQEQSLLARLEREIARKAGTRDPVRELEDALLDAVIEHPERDDPRLIYADWLREREDPRGELIQLEYALRDGKKVKGKREAALRAAKAALLGPQAPMIEHFELDRGLLDKVWVSLHPRGTSVPPAEMLERLRDRRWRTVREIVSHHDVSDLLRHGPLDSLQRLSRPPLACLLALTERSSPLPLRWLTAAAPPMTDPAYDGLEAVHPWLPQLRELELECWTGLTVVLPPPAFFRAPLLRQLERLSLRPGQDIDEWLERLVAAGSPVSLVEMPDPLASLSLTRADDGRYRVLLSLAPGSERQQSILAATFRRVRSDHVASLELVSPHEPLVDLREAVRHLARIERVSSNPMGSGS